MKDFFERAVISLEMLSALKKSGMLNPMTVKLLLSAHTSKEPSRELSQLGNAVRFSKMFGSPFVKPDISVNGPIGLAISENKQLIGMFPDECHGLIAGQTGMGKTILLRLVFSQATVLSLKTWLFVRAKDMRSLIDVSRDVLIVTFDGKIKINPLNPCDISESDYCNIFSDIFIQSQRLYDGTKNYLMENLNTLYEKHREHKTYPSMHDLYFYIRGLKHPYSSRTSYFRESAMNRLGGMIFGTLGKVFDCSEGHEKALMNHNCIFEIGNLTTEQQVFIVNLMLSKLFYHRLNNSNENWFFAGIDDGNLLFDASFEKRPDLGLPIIHHLLSTVRKSRINVFCCSQTPHQLGASIHSNSAIKIMFSLANGNDIECMQKSMGNLDKDQKAFCYSLDKRQIIIKNSLRFREPVLGVVPEIPEARFVDDDEITRNNELIMLKLPAIVPRYKPENKVQEEVNNADVSDNTKKWLMAVNLYQYKKTLTEIYELASFSAGTGSRIAQECEKKNLVKTLQVKSGRGSPKYPVLLSEAYKVLGIEEKKFYGRGAGYEHVLWQHLIVEHFSEYKPVIEKFKDGKAIDVAIETNELFIAIEVAMTSAHEKENIDKDFSKAKADLVIVACKDQKVLKEVREIVSGMPEQFRNKTDACLLSELLKKNPDDLLKNL